MIIPVPLSGFIPAKTALRKQIKEAVKTEAPDPTSSGSQLADKTVLAKIFVVSLNVPV